MWRVGYLLLCHYYLHGIIKNNVAYRFVAEKDEKKFTKILIDLLLYSGFFLAGHVVTREPYLFDYSMWVTSPTHWNELNNATRVYYTWYMERYIYEAIGMCIFYTYSKSDFKELLVHHLLTSVLIYLAYPDWVRVGSVIMFLFDFTDPLLHLAKLFLLCKYEMCSEISFVFFVCMFVLTRILLFGHIVFNIICFEIPRLIDPDVSVVSTIVASNLLLPIIILAALFAMQVMWTHAIYKVIEKKLVHGELEDRD